MLKLNRSFASAFVAEDELVSYMDEHADVLAGLPAGTISASGKNLPGIVEIIQVVKGHGGRMGGDAGDICLRLSDRIAHRNRALLPADYERLVLQHFPQVVKVKCLPGLDTKKRNRSGVVTLVIVPRQEGGDCYCPGSRIAYRPRRGNL